MDEPGAPRDHRPRKGFWARFSEQETGPQKVLVGLAGTMTALATTVGGIYALTNVVGDDDQSVATDPASSTSTTGQPTSEPTTGPSEGVATPTATASLAVPLQPGQTLVAQGSKEADDLVHLLVDKPGGRAELNHVILPETREQRLPYIMRLWYNCQGLPEGQPPGPDLCSSVFFTFDDSFPPGPTYLKGPKRILLQGIWVDARPTGAGYGAEGLVVYPAPASF